MKVWFSRIFLIVILFAIFTGCTKDIDDRRNHLGKWVEESPVEARTELYFLSPKTVVFSKNGDSEEQFLYHIEGDSIYLNQESGEGPQQQSFFFKLIDAGTLQIEDLYVSVPEVDTYIILKRGD